MPSAVYTNAKFLAATDSLEWVDLVATFRAMLLSDGYVYSPSHIHVSDVDAFEISGAGYARQDVTGRTAALDLGNQRALLDAGNVQFPNFSSSGAQIQSCVIYKQVGGDDSTPEDDELICYLEFTAFTASNQQLQVEFSAQGVFALGECVFTGNALAGALQGVTTISAALTATGLLAGDVVGQTVHAGNLSQGLFGELGGTLVGGSFFSGAVTSVQELTGLVPGASTLSGALGGVGALAGQALGESALAAALSAEADLGGTVAGSSALTGGRHDFRGPHGPSGGRHGAHRRPWGRCGAHRPRAGSYRLPGGPLFSGERRGCPFELQCSLWVDLGLQSRGGRGADL
jgi:hypothetical protein